MLLANFPRLELSQRIIFSQTKLSTDTPPITESIVTIKIIIQLVKYHNPNRNKNIVKHPDTGKNTIQ